MKQEFYNSAAIFDIEGGHGELQVCVCTRISNPKRRSLLCNLAVDQITNLEELVRDMDHDEVARLHAELEPHQGNGNGKDE